MSAFAAPCDAGRTAFHEGRWRTPCPNPAMHFIATEGMDLLISLCDRHFQEVADKGLVTDQNVSEEEFLRRTRRP